MIWQLLHIIDITLWVLILGSVAYVAFFAVISLFYEQFMQFEVVKAIFKGLSIGVIVLIGNAFIKLKKSAKLNISTTILFLVVLTYLVANYFLEIKIPFFTLILILFGFLFGIVFEVLLKGRRK